MNFFIIVVLVLIAVTSAFSNHGRSMFSLKPSIMKLSSERKSTSLVPLEKVNIEQAVSVTGGILGFVLVGPIGGVIFAAISNYVSKKDSDAGDALRGLGKTVIESYNFITNLNSKYNFTGKASDAIGNVVANAEADSEALSSVTKTASSVASKVSEINKEFDLLTKTSEAIKVAGTLSDTAIDKVIELNEKVSYF